MKLQLETNRLILRPFTIEDATDMYFNWASDPEVTKYVTWNPHKGISETKEILKRWIEEYDKPEELRFAMVLKDSGDLIGGINVCGYEGGVDGIPIIGYASGKNTGTMDI